MIIVTLVVISPFNRYVPPTGVLKMMTDFLRLS